MLKCYARIFFITGILFCLGIFFSDLSFMAPRAALVNAIASGLIFGAGMALVMGTLHIVRARKTAGENRKGDIYAVKQRAELRTALPYDRLFAVVGHYLGEVAGFTVTEKNHESGVISARSNFTFRTFGSKITATLRKDGESATLLTLTSSPLLGTTLADYGENLRIVREAEDFLSASEHH
jgi:hypothetical protein